MPTDQEILDRRSQEHGFNFTEEHLQIERLVDLLEARAARRKPARPQLTLIKGGYPSIEGGQDA
jgi:hypothetical protein